MLPTGCTDGTASRYYKGRYERHAEGPRTPSHRGRRSGDAVSVRSQRPSLADGPTFGGGLGQCGCCTVIARGQAIRSCVTPADTLFDATGARIREVPFTPARVKAAAGK